MEGSYVFSTSTPVLPAHFHGLLIGKGFRHASSEGDGVDEAFGKSHLLLLVLDGFHLAHERAELRDDGRQQIVHQRLLFTFVELSADNQHRRHLENVHLIVGMESQSGRIADAVVADGRRRTRRGTRAIASGSVPRQHFLNSVRFGFSMRDEGRRRRRPNHQQIFDSLQNVFDVIVKQRLDFLHESREQIADASADFGVAVPQPAFVDKGNEDVRQSRLIGREEAMISNDGFEILQDDG